MLCAAVHIHTPVGLCISHFLFEGDALIWWNHWVVGTNAHQNLCGDRTRSNLARGTEARVETNNGCEVGSGANEFETHRSAKAITDGSDTRCINPRLAQQNIETSLRALHSFSWRSNERHQFGHHVFERNHLAVTVIIECECHKTKSSQTIGFGVSVLRNSGAFMTYQYARSFVVSFGKRKVTDVGNAF